MYTVKKLQSGFYSVWINDTWINAALPSEESAREFIKKLESAQKRAGAS